jgi:NhaP-type Na+/H+ or K+/H+ antiporter
VIEVYILVFSFAVLIFGLISLRIERMVITAPMVFVIAGLLTGTAGYIAPEYGLGQDLVLILVELTLVLTLFTDAARINLPRHWGSISVPVRLLAIGLPLTILAGMAGATILFPGLTLLEVALLAIILTPTDAGLALPIVNNPRVPVRIRNALNIESGLNDGIVFPIFIVALAVLESELSSFSTGSVLTFILEQVGLGVLTGIFIGLAGGWLMSRAIGKGWMSPTYQRLGLVALAFITWALAGEIGGNGFIAAFTGGLFTGYVLKALGKKVIDFAEAEGQLLILGVFFIFGIFMATLLPDMTWQYVAYAVISLTIVRMIPVKISLAGSRLGPRTGWFVGWFGPRGLASIVLLILALQQLSSDSFAKIIALAVGATVTLSVFAHGITTLPLINRYANVVAAMSPDAPEKELVEEVPARSSTIFGHHKED